jgi:hypothetical protein
MRVDGAWHVSKLSPSDNQQRSAENLRNAKSYTCQRLPDSSVQGAPVSNYRARTETEDAVNESTISILKSTGLALQVQNTITEGGGRASTYVTQYSYDGIRAPALQK